MPSSTDAAADPDDPDACFLLRLRHEIGVSLRMIAAACGDPPHADATCGFDARSLVLANARRIERTADQAIDLALIARGRLIPRLRPHDLGRLIHAVADVFRAVAVERGLRLTAPDPPAPLIWAFDAVMVEKVMAGLLSNAIGHTPGGGFVAVGAERRGAALRIAVVASESGIYPVLPPRSPVVRRRDGGQPWAGDHGGGTALALCRRLVELQGGELYVRSRDGFGSSTIIELPCRPCAAGPAQEAGFGTIAALECAGMFGLPQPGAAAPRDRPRVLVASLAGDGDDRVPAVLAVRFEVETAYQVAVALSRIRRAQPDLVVLDLPAWPEGAPALLAALRRDGATDCIPVLALVRRLAPGDASRAISDGVDELLPRDIDSPALHLRCAALIEQRQRLGLWRQRPAVVAESALQARRRGWLEKLHRIVHSNLHDDGLTVERLADKLHTSRSQLFRRVKAATGLSPQAYIAEARLRRAALLLERRAGSVSEIVGAVGFSTLSHFSRSFRRRFGVPPSEYPGTLPEDASAAPAGRRGA